MERLTVKRKDGRWALADNGETSKFEKLDKIPRAVDRLAAYEDIFFDNEGKEIVSLDHLKELVQAENDGQLVALPCKKGDVLWSFFTYPRKGIYSFCITATSTLDGVTTLNTDKLGVILASDVGKTVFLTREEAEAALAEEGAENA